MGWLDDVEDGAVRSEEDPRPVLGEGRYVDLGPLGAGGMAEVRRVRDQRLNRVVAMKRLRADKRTGSSTHRFVEEAQATAQLQHPGIVPTYDLGTLEDGRPFFTMKEVEGVTLGALIDHVHGRARLARPPGERSWTIQRLVEVVRRAAEAVAFAHARAVVHRDLKRSNVMVGSYGEVYVLDWGLAKVLGSPSPGPASTTPSDPRASVVTDRSRGGPSRTRFGAVVGTPAYMAPEQIGRDERTPLGPQADVYALGATLWEVLTGVPPFPGLSSRELLAAKRQAEGPPAPEAPATAMPEELAPVVRRALSRDPEARWPDAAALPAELARWLDGEIRRRRATSLVEEACTRRPLVDRWRAEAQAAEARAEALLDELPGWAPVEDKRAAWALEAEARELRRRAEVEEALYVQALHTALNHDPALRQAHVLLAAHHRAAHEAAEACRDTAAAARHEALLRLHDLGEHAAYLDGNGSLTLAVVPGDAVVQLERYAPEDRRLVARPHGRGLSLPAESVPLPQGSYRVVIEAPGHARACLPVRIDRQRAWSLQPPGASAPRVLRLPPAEAVAADGVWIPPGWAELGGDPGAYEPLEARRVWIEGFVMQRTQVTNRDYLAFLNDLVDRGAAEEARRVAPRERAAAAEGGGAPVYGTDATGHFHLQPDADGDEWDPDWPVVMVDWHGALAYARWRSARDGRPWRLPTELEWEKAARGADGRWFPWGDGFDPTYARVRTSHRGRWLPARVDEHPRDESPYGVRGLAGNVSDWCADPYTPDGPGRDGVLWSVPEVDPRDDRPRVHRGGRWNGSERGARAATRLASDPSVRTFFLGFRLVYSLPG